MNPRGAAAAFPAPTAGATGGLGKAFAALIALVGSGIADELDLVEIEVEVDAIEVVDVWAPPKPCMINSPICIELRLVLDMDGLVDGIVTEAATPVEVGTMPCIGSIVVVPSTIKAVADTAGLTETEMT